VLQLKDGDTILVRPRGVTVAVSGDVRNPAVFELRGAEVDGRTLLRWSRPKATATHAVWNGLQNGIQGARYLNLSGFESEIFRDGDKLELFSDAHADVITVQVEGAFEGQSRFVVPKGTRLGELLDLIAVPKDQAAYEAISIRRKSILEQQRLTIEESLRRLEGAYLRASSQTNEEASIRVTEAGLISDFVKRVHEAEPSGRLVLGNLASASSLRLQADDIVTIPERTDTITISGEILIPQAILFDEGMSLEDYISQAGGYTELADPENVLLIRQNGQVVVAADNKAGPGDQYLVLPKVPSKYLQVAKEIVDVVYKVAVSAGVLIRLN
jgi:hypothetical protein